MYLCKECNFKNEFMIIKKLLLTLCIAVSPLCNKMYADTFVTHCKVTTYNAPNGSVTKDGSTVNNKDIKSGKVKWCAVSRDLEWKLTMGTIIEIEGYGRYEVHDTTGPNQKHTIDLLQHPSKKHIMEDKVKVRVIKHKKKEKK